MGITQPQRSKKTEVWVLYGGTGTGKSYFALKRSAQEDTYWKQRGGWWDNYLGQKTVVIDEYKAWLPWTVFLQVMDEYPLQVEVKNGNVQFLAETVVFTTNWWPRDWYSSDKHPFEAFQRRVDHWVMCHKMIDDVTENHVDCGKDYAKFIEEANKTFDF